MRSFKSLTWFMLATMLFGIQTVVLAVDPMQVAPNMYKLLFENDRIRAMKVTFKPGEKIAPHSHPDHFVHVIQGGMLKIYDTKGVGKENMLSEDQVIWIPAETHSAENVGKTTIVLIVNELKPAGVK